MCTEKADGVIFGPQNNWLKVFVLKSPWAEQTGLNKLSRKSLLTWPLNLLWVNVSVLSTKHGGKTCFALLGIEQRTTTLWPFLVFAKTKTWPCPWKTLAWPLSWVLYYTVWKKVRLVTAASSVLLLWANTLPTNAPFLHTYMLRRTRIYIFWGWRA